jgi:hypothetical protein
MFGLFAFDEASPMCVHANVGKSLWISLAPAALNSM